MRTVGRARQDRTRAIRDRLCSVEGLTPREAFELQREAADLVVTDAGDLAPRTVAGIDVSVKGPASQAAVAVLAFPSLAPVETATARMPVVFPYVPGLLAFREVPVVLAAFARLRSVPDLLMVDGHGFAHPRRFGVACHLGVALDLPAIGVGKTRFVGAHQEPGPRRGASVRLVDRGDTIGRVVRTREGVKPVHVSVGHRISLGDAVRLVLRCCARFRLPEPIRAAHHAAGATLP